jgi:hypothetical protein
MAIDKTKYDETKPHQVALLQLEIAAEKLGLDEGMKLKLSPEVRQRGESATIPPSIWMR